MQDYILDLQKRLERRHRRILEGDRMVFGAQVGRLLNFVYAEPVLNALVEELDTRYPAAKHQAQMKGLPTGPEEAEHVTIAHHKLRDIASQPRNSLAASLTHHADITTIADAFAQAKVELLAPFVDYLLEQVSARRYALELLKRFKQRSERFDTERMHGLWQDRASEPHARAEAVLADQLYSYLFDQGLTLNVEPDIGVGRIDLLAFQGTSDPLPCEVKIYNPGSGTGKWKGAAYICQGFHQLHRYLEAHGEAIGYLFIFNVTKDYSLLFDLPAKGEGVFRFVYSHLTVYFVVANIHPARPTASKSGTFKTDRIGENDLIKAISGPPKDDGFDHADQG